MARVPQVTPGGATVDIRPVAPSYQQTSGLLVDAIQSRGAAANIERAAQKVEGAGNVLADEAIKAQIEDNERAAKKADIALSEQMRAIMFGDGTPENPGFYGLKGEAALAAYPKVREQMAEARKNIGGTLTNPKAREMFELSANSRFETEARAMGRFNQQERTVANDAISERRIREANDYAIAGWNNPEQVDKAHAILRGEVISRGQRNGEAPEVIASKLQEEQSKMYAGMINAALVYNPAEAQKLYDKYKPAIDGSVRPAIELKLEAGTSLQQVQEQTKAILAGGGTPEQMLAKAGNLTQQGFSPQVQDGVEKAVEHKIVWKQARDNYAMVQAEKAAMQSASRAVSGGMPFDQWAQENPQYAWVVAGKVGAVDNLYRIEKLRAEGEMFSKVTTGALQKLRATPAGELAEYDLENNRYSYTRDEYEKASQLVEGAKQRIAELTQSGSKVMNEAQQRINFFIPRDSKGKPQNISPADAEIASNEMSGWVASYVKTNGKPPTMEAMDAEAARIMVRVTVGDGYNDGVPSSKTIAGRIKFMSPEEKATLRVPYKDIPAATLESIRAKFKQHKISPTDTELEEYAGAVFLGKEGQARREKLLRIKKGQ